MFAIFLETLPFFAVIGLGYGAGRTGFFNQDATAYLTKFVFYFALSAMLFRFSATQPLAALFEWNFVKAYLAASAVVYVGAVIFALVRGIGISEAAFEAQCAVIGNVGFLGIPMLALLLGPEAVASVILVLGVDLIVFGSLIVIIVTASRSGRLSPMILVTIAMGLLKNPMIVSIGLGFAWSSLSIPMPDVLEDFLILLGAAATPGALFAIGASLASKSAERVSVAVWLSFAKLVLHPAAVAVAALMIWPVEPYAAGVMIAAAALPVAGNVFILAQHYSVAPQRVSAAILISTAVSVVTVALVIGWVKNNALIGERPLETLAENRAFGGTQGVYKHGSKATGGEMTFGLFLPDEARFGPVPLLWYLSGLTCTHENAMVKAGAQAHAANHGIALVFPDTSPRGEDVADDEAYDLGQGAGFYIDATEAPWAAHFNMETYILGDLTETLFSSFSLDPDAQAITGHSMGGHGALTLAAKDGRFKSVSAFSPICNPTQSDWGKKQFEAYLGSVKAGEAHDATCLIREGALEAPVLIDTGTDDQFGDLLHTEALAEALLARRMEASVRLQKGYDHSYFFVSTFIEDHIEFHAEALYS